MKPNIPILVTPYINPDIDGIASARAYAELLNSVGRPAEAGIAGEPLLNARLPLRIAGVPAPKNVEETIHNYNAIILVDGSNPNDFPPTLDRTKVIELVDHRTYDFREHYPRAMVQNELVGSCSTLIAERWNANQLTPPMPTALLLYSAIVSDTFDGKSPLTTDRDRAMQSWLGRFVTLPADYAIQLFEDRSRLTKPLKDILLDDATASGTYGGKRVGCLQIEVINLQDALAREPGAVVEALRELKTRDQLDYAFFNGIDIGRATTTLIAFDTPTQQLLAAMFGVAFQNNHAHLNRIVLRKQHPPLLRRVLGEKS